MGIIFHLHSYGILFQCNEMLTENQTGSNVSESVDTPQSSTTGRSVNRLVPESPTLTPKSCPGQGHRTSMVLRTSWRRREGRRRCRWKVGTTPRREGRELGCFGRSLHYVFCTGVPSRTWSAVPGSKIGTETGFRWYTRTRLAYIFLGRTSCDARGSCSS